MTTPSSCNSYFKKYLFYKLRTQMIPFIVSVLLNVTLLPPFAIELMLWYNGVDLKMQSNDYMLYVPAVITFIMALTGAPRAFTICTKSDHVDTLGSLPLTRKQHFFADLLSGYIVNVGPSIPCIIFSLIIAACTNGKFAKQFFHLEPLFYFKWFFLMSLSLFAAYTFAYIVSAFVTVCCGKTSISIIFTIAVSTLLMSSAAGIGEFIKQCVTGMELNVDYLLNFIPPFGLLNCARAYYLYFAGIDLSHYNHLELPHPALVIAYIVIGAAVIFASYYIFKNRKAERTGSAIASNVLYKVMIVLSVITITSVTFALAYDLHAVWIPLLISIAITAVLILILEAIRGLKKARLAVTGLRGLITVFVCFAVLMIVDGSGAFGARYINVSPSKVKSLEITEWRSLDSSIAFSSSEIEGFIFLDQKEIEEFIDSHNQTLKEHNKDFRNGFIFQVQLTLNSGEVINRQYSPNSFRLFSKSDPSEAMNKLSKNVYSLGSYNEKASDLYKRKFASYPTCDINIRTLGVFGEVTIPAEKRAEFEEMFTSEFNDKFGSADKTAAMIQIEYNDNIHYPKTETVIYIPESCTETLAFIDELRSDDQSCEALTVWCYRGTNPVAGFTFDLKTLNTDLGQELLSLLSTDKSTESPDRANRYDITSTDMNHYYVPAENSDRVFEILLDLIEAAYSEEPI